MKKLGITLGVLLTICQANSSEFADIEAVTVSGNENNYYFSVTIRSPDTGCEQYANWWEILSADGKLLYRRILAHSHVNEQPFTRSGSAVLVSKHDKLHVRAHMNHSGYGGAVFSGSVAGGFKPADKKATQKMQLVEVAQPKTTCAF